MKIKLFTFPNILTLCNLLCGAGATVAALRYGDLFWPLVLIVTAAVFDFLDGFAARLLKSYSPLGRNSIRWPTASVSEWHLPPYC